MKDESRGTSPPDGAVSHLTKGKEAGYAGMPVLLAPVSLWLLWRSSAEPETATTVAALIPIAYWGPFFVALVIPGADLVDPDTKSLHSHEYKSLLSL